VSKLEGPNPEAIKAAALKALGTDPPSTPNAAFSKLIHPRKKSKWWLNRKAQKLKWGS